MSIADSGDSHDFLAPKFEERLLLIDKSGSGNVYFLKITDNQLPKKDLDIYKEHWEELHHVTGYAVCYDETHVYILGGFDRRTKQHLATCRRYSPRLDLWELLPPMIYARVNSAAAISSGKVYVTGGERSSGRVTRSCEAFNLKAWCWERVGMLPAARKHHRVTTDGVTVFISGGELGGKLQPTVWLSEDYTWNKMDPDYPIVMSRCRTRHVMEHHQGTLYFIGGVTCPKITSLIEKSPEPEKTQKEQSGTSETDLDTILENSENAIPPETSLKALSSSAEQNQKSNGAKKSQHTKKSKKSNQTDEKSKKLSVTNKSNFRNDQKRHLEDDNADAIVLTSQLNDIEPKTPDPGGALLNGVIIDNSMESFMPVVRSDVTDDSWYISPWNWHLPPMDKARLNAASIILGTSLYVVGGTGEDGKPVCVIEELDLTKMIWNKHALLSNCNISNVAAVKISCNCNRRPEPDKIGDQRPDYKWILW